jgi:hypothetical protein
MIFALLLQVADTPSLANDVWAELSYSASLAYRSETIEILRGEPGRSKDDVTLRLISRRLHEAPHIMWASSRACPGAAEAVRGLRAIPMPTPLLPDDAGDIILDGVGYRVRIFARYGSESGFPIELRSNAGTPLSTWVNQTFGLLKPCWSKVRPS